MSSAVFLTRAGDPWPTGARSVAVARGPPKPTRPRDRRVWLATLLQVIVSAGYGAIAVANTLLMAATSRHHDLRVL